MLAIKIPGVVARNTDASGQLGRADPQPWGTYPARLFLWLDDCVIKARSFSSETAHRVRSSGEAETLGPLVPLHEIAGVEIGMSGQHRPVHDDGILPRQFDKALFPQNPERSVHMDSREAQGISDMYLGDRKGEGNVPPVDSIRPARDFADQMRGTGSGGPPPDVD